MSQDINLCLAALSLVVPSGLVPAPTLAGGVTASGRSFSVTSTAGIVEGSMLTWWDGSDEDFSIVESVSGATVTLTDPLTCDHANGAQLASNLLDGALPVDVSEMVQESGFPVIAAYVLDGVYQAHSTSQAASTPVLSIVHDLPATQRPVVLRPQAFERQQTRRTAENVETIIKLIFAHQRLIWQGTGESRGVAWARKAIRRVDDTPTAPRWQAVIDFQINGRPIPTGG